MGANEIRKGDIGTEFIMTFKDRTAVVDISTCTTLEIHFKKPDDSVVVKDGIFITDGTDGKIYCVATTGFLDQIGMWEWQGYAVMPTGEKWKTDVSSFTVHDNLKEN